jgi:hypothetical protein
MRRLSDRVWAGLMISALCVWTIAVYAIVYNLL